MLRESPEDPTPEEFVKFEIKVLDEVREAVKLTRLPRYFPNTVLLLTIRDGVISARVKQQEFVLPSAF